MCRHSADVYLTGCCSYNARLYVTVIVDLNSFAISLQCVSYMDFLVSI
jgi:hypothetical protein